MKRILFVCLVLASCFLSSCKENTPRNQSTYNTYQVNMSVVLGDTYPTCLRFVNSSVYYLEKQSHCMQLVQRSLNANAPVILEDNLPKNCLLATQNNTLLMFQPEETTWDIYVISDQTLDLIMSFSAPTNSEVIDFRLDKDLTLYALTENELYVCSSDAITTLDSPNAAPFAKLALCSNGKVFAQLAPANRVESWESFQVLSVDGTKLVPLLDTPSGAKPLIGGQIEDGNAYDLYTCQDGFIQGLDLEHTALVPMVSTTDFGKNKSLLSFQSEENDRFLALLVDQNTGEYTVVVLEKTEISKEIVELAVVGSVNRFLDAAIASFNDMSNQYTVQVNYFDADQQYSALKIAMTTGNTPDLLSVYGSDYATFIKQGMLTNLIDSSNKNTLIPISELLPHVVEELMYKNGLYAIYPEFQIKTAIQNTPSINISELLEWKRSNPERSVFFGISQTETLELLLKGSLKNFVDYDNGSCTLNSPEFCEILELAKTGSDMSDAMDLPLMELCTINGIRDYQALSDKVGDKPCFSGIPCSDGSVSLINGLYSVALCEKSQNRAGALNFLNYLLGAEYQSEVECLPVHSEIFEARIEQARQAETVTIEQYADAQAAAEGENTDLNQVKKSYAAASQSEIEEFKDMLSNAKNSVVPYYTDILNIILDEFQPYCQNICSVETASDNMQARISTLLSEQA